MTAVVRSLSLACVFATLPVALHGQTRDSELRQAFEFERRGQYDQAATLFRESLGRNPANLSALLGLERVLRQIDDLAGITPLVDSALSLQPLNRSIRAMQLRVWAALAQADSLTGAAARWIALAPDSPEPYREWALALRQSGDPVEAQRVLADGIARLGDATLSQDMAELTAATGEWVEAARQWRTALDANPVLLSAAAVSLTRTPPSRRQEVLNALGADRHDALGGRLTAELLVAWGRPLEGWRALERALPDDPRLSVALLRRFADQARLVRSNEAARARGYALERLAEISAGPTAERALLEAARAFADAGDRRAAERVLERIAGGANSGGRAAAEATAALIEVMARSGRLKEAEDHFYDWHERLSPDDARALRELIAQSWLSEGDLDRAEGVLGDDSTVSSFAVRGWIALYRGDLRGASTNFGKAGSRAGDREAATRRTEMLALIQQIEPDSAPEIGAALLRLARRDSARAVRDLERAAKKLPPQGGRADVLGYAGRVAVQMGDVRAAELLLLSAIEADPSGAAAPLAHYELAQAYIQMGRRDTAAGHLERLILTYSESAIVPQARRLLDHVRGSIPQT